MSTLQELRIKTRNEYIKIDPSGKIWDDTTLNALINRAYFQVQSDGGHKRPAQYDNYTFSTVSGTATYALPTDFIKMEVPTYNYQQLKKTEQSTIKRVLNGPVVPGIPYAYYIYGTNIGLYPTPSTTGTVDIEYYKKLPKLTDSQDSELPIDFDDAICLYASYLAFNSVSKIDKASVMRADYTGALGTLLASYIYDDVNIGYGYQNNIDSTPSDTSTYNLR